MTTGITLSTAARAPRPFRSHRTFRTGVRESALALGACVLGGICAYGALVYAWAPCLRFAAAVAFGANGALMLPDRYLGIAYAVPLPVMPAVGVAPAIWTASACALVIFASSLLPGARTPLRYWINANALVLGGSALYAFFHGTVGYDAAPFMLLITRTGLLTIAIAVPFLTIVSAMLTFTFIERVAMIAAALAFELVAYTVRVAAFALFLQYFGSVPQANLYIFAGPLLDVAYFIAVYSMTASMASARLARTEDAWKWL